eukprot:746762-Ditylum_brightwellii.AAC.1
MTGVPNGLKQNMQVGTFCFISDSTHGLVIHVGKVVISELAMQVQLPTSTGTPELGYCGDT